LAERVEVGRRRGELSPLIGRAGELARLQSAWERVCTDGFTAVSVEGGAGIGKTRLIDATLEAIESSGGDRVTVRCSPDAHHRPLHAVVDGLSGRLTGETAGTGATTSRFSPVGKLSRDAQASLRQLLVAAGLEPPFEHDAATDPATARDDRLDALVSVLALLARRHPLAVVVEDLHAGETAISGDEGHHLARVLRVRPGDEVRAFDGRGRESLGVVREVDRDRVVIDLAAPVASETEPEVELTVAVALLKGNKPADVVRMGTELGVRRFALLETARAEPDDLSKSKLQRLERVAREAAKQSGRAVIPELVGPIAIHELELGDQCLVADPRAEVRVLEHVWAHRGTLGSWTTVTGPEGGLDSDEVDALVSRGATPVSLGRSILRAETAPVALATVVLLGAGSMPEAERRMPGASGRS
jgi:16S rRNA (uracil1498-N3)-methyltransferase